jgi:predicted dehydrogenase
MKKLSVCIIGMGRIFQKHLDAINYYKKYFFIESVCDNNIKNLNKIKFKNKIKKFNNIDETCNKSRADIAVILTPSGYHYKHILKVSKFFKNIIVEKPMVMNFSDAKKIIKYFDYQKKNLFIVKQNRFNPAIIKLKDAIDKKRFGKIFLATIRLRWNRNNNYFLQDSWRGTWKLDGGVLANQASHHIDLLQWLVGDVKSVYAKTIKIVKSTNVPDTCVCVVKFKNGAIGSIETTTAAQPKNIEGSISILGTKGTVVIGGFAVSKIDVWDFNKKEKVDKNIKKFSSVNKNVYGFGHKEFYKNVYNFILKKKNSVTTYNDGAKSIKLIDKIYTSSELSKEIFINDKYFSKKLGK